MDKPSLPKRKVCKQCKCLFDQKYGRPKKYCSSKCSLEAMKSPRNKPNIKKGSRLRYGPEKKCANCNETFVAYRSTSVVCSKKCFGERRRKTGDWRGVKAWAKKYWSEPKNRLKRAKKLKLITLDGVAREICRLRSGCEATGFHDLQCKGSLHWAHIISRTYHKVRWDEDNCLLLCAAHHIFYTYRHIQWEQFLDQKIGRDKYDELKRRAMVSGKVFKPDVYEKLLIRLNALKSTRS